MSGVRWRKTRSLISTMLRVLSKNINTFRVSNSADIRFNNIKRRFREDKTSDNEYQMEREIIEQQRNEINNIYKRMILQNKDMEIKISALTNENIL